jgi:hypothetical protein
MKERSKERDNMMSEIIAERNSALAAQEKKHALEDGNNRRRIAELQKAYASLQTSTQIKERQTERAVGLSISQLFTINKLEALTRRLVCRFLLKKFRMKKLLETMLRDMVFFVSELSQSGAERVERKLGSQQSEVDAWKNQTTLLLKANSKKRPSHLPPRDKPLHKELAAQLHDMRLVLELAMAAQMKGRAKAEQEASAFASENIASKDQVRSMCTEVQSLKTEAAKLNKDNERLQAQVDDALKYDSFEPLVRPKSEKGKIEKAGSIEPPAWAKADKGKLSQSPKMEKGGKLQLKAPMILAPHEAGSALFRPRTSAGYPALVNVAAPDGRPHSHAARRFTVAMDYEHRLPQFRNFPDAQKFRVRRNTTV